jgi:N-acetylneuraminate synthase
MTKLISEIGINHDGDYEKGKKLIDLAVDTKAWGIKFQYRDLKNYFSRKILSSEIGKEILDIEIKKNYLSPIKIKKLSNYAKKKKLKVGISFFSENDSIKFSNFSFDFYKIPSAMSDNYNLIKYLKKKNSLLIVSFGGRNFYEIKKIVKDCALNNKNTVLLHCISNYPTSERNSNLGFIDTLKKNFKNCKIGYSSHESTIISSILCLSKKVDFVERHITLNKKSKGLDHSSSSDYDELRLFQNYNKHFKSIFFEKKKMYSNQGEIINIQNLGASYYFKKNVKTGSLLKIKDLELRQPNVGITDLNLENYIKKKLITNAIKNEPLTESYFKVQEINHELIKKFNKNNFSLPIRPRDYKNISNQIPLDNYEMHMTFKDINNFKLKQFDKKFIKYKNFTIHMPDYCDTSSIIDFFSNNKILRKKSIDILNKTIKIAQLISSINIKTVNIIVSLAKLNSKDDRFIYYKKIKNLVKKIKKKYNINLFPQWLPAKAWYFGGSMDTKAFSNPNDMSFIKKIKLNLCLDVSHFILSCNFHHVDKKLFFSNHMSIFKHYHLSDASGIDGEGVLIGNGDLKNSGLLELILKDKKKIKVLETWQGHLNNCTKFKQDALKLNKYL